MCGIFAYHGPGRPDPGLLWAAALGAGRRGPHGYGWAQRDTTGAVSTWREIGALTGQQGRIRTLTGPLILGHARLATTGDWRDRNQLQPALAGGHAVAHNGVIYNPDDLHPGAVTDSYALAAGYAALRYGGASPYQALDKLTAAAEQTTWAIVVMDTAGRLYGHRHGHPLWQLRLPSGGMYLSSQQFHSGAVPVPECQSVLLVGEPCRPPA